MHETYMLFLYVPDWLWVLGQEVMESNELNNTEQDRQLEEIQHLLMFMDGISKINLKSKERTATKGNGLISL